MGLDFIKYRETRVGYIPYNICGIEPRIDESEHKFKIILGISNKELVKDKNIEDKMREKEIIKEPYIPVLLSIERKIENYRR